MLWLIFALLTLAVLAILLYPFLSGATSEAPPRVDYDIVVYRNQLAEIDQEIERGLLTEEQAEAARAEVYRRMLAAEDAELKMPFRLLHGDNRFARIAAVAVIADRPAARRGAALRRARLARASRQALCLAADP